MLGSILFNMYLNELFIFLNEIEVCNFDNNNTPSMFHKKLAELLENFLRNSELPIHCFENNYVNLNTDKCLVKNQVFYVNLKVFQQPRILCKSLFGTQFEYCKVEH